ncbi:unnamed protein product [Brachionus calyciflorus]|uniref:Regulator of microtubule dynamics protein 1 n=1 Tax=Brachionus calyciflorus TaxID=104777 RepID=A0A813XB95_9BILA|nr:unnamed protein product [Brachionus calyciflorus]
MEALNSKSLNNARRKYSPLIIFGFGTVGISIFLLYKYWKLRKLLIELEAKVRELSLQVDSLNEKQTNIELNRPSRSVNKTSRHDSLSSYDTPSTSPERIPTLSQSNNQSNILTFNYQNESYESLKEKYFEKKDFFDQFPSNFEDAIDYLRIINALDEKEIDPSSRKEYRMNAFNLAKTCLDFYPDNYLSHKWYAIFTGKITEYCSINEKVKYGFEFKKHLDIAIEMEQSDSVLYYLRGRWYYKMSKLNWAETYAIKLIFGNIPKITMDDAFNDFLQAENLNPQKSKGNLLYISRCFIEKNDKENALKYLNYASMISSKNNEEDKDEKEVIQMTKKYL